MDLQKISLDPLTSRRVAVLGYGNQGRAQALNLRDSGVEVRVGARPGKGAEQARRDGFEPLSPEEAVSLAEVVVFLLPDQIIPGVYAALGGRLDGKIIGFSHGFCLHFGFLEIRPGARYFLVGPKGAGALLRKRFEEGKGLPGVYALGPNADEPTRAVALAYARAIGVATSILLETTVAEETECDLFGEQAVLCGGILELMERAFQTLVKNGHSPEMAFFECCFEAAMITELWMRHGPRGLADAISPTAFYGGKTRGRRLITGDTQKVLDEMFAEVRSGAFAKEWMEEVAKGAPRLKQWKQDLAASALQKTYDSLKPRLP